MRSPEDVLVSLPIAQIVCGADENMKEKGGGKLTKMMMRRLISQLLDRSLLMGSLTNGFQFHGLVRDLVRRRIGNRMQTKQKAVVEAFIHAHPEEGWGVSDPVGQYAKSALTWHSEFTSEHSNSSLLTACS